MSEASIEQSLRIVAQRRRTKQANNKNNPTVTAFFFFEFKSRTKPGGANPGRIWDATCAIEL